MAEITMPRLSDTMSEGTVGKWLKQPGDKVENGEIIAEIETDKATMELQAFESGTLQKILVPEGQTVPIGQPVARRLAEDRGIDLRLVRGTGPGGRIIKENVEDFKPSEAQAAAPTPAQMPTAAAAPQPRQPAPAPEAVPMSRMRRAIARAMTE